MRNCWIYRSTAGNAVKLVDYYYKKYKGTPIDAINHAMVRIRGSYDLAVMFKDYPEEIYVTRKDSPMLLYMDMNIVKYIKRKYDDSCNI